MSNALQVKTISENNIQFLTNAKKFINDFCIFDNSLPNTFPPPQQNEISSLDTEFSLEELNVAIENGKPDCSPDLDQISFRNTSQTFRIFLLSVINEIFIKHS